MAEAGKRFVSVDEVDLKQLLLDKDSKNTKKATKVAFKVFQSYLNEKKIDINLEEMPPQELNDNA